MWDLSQDENFQRGYCHAHAVDPFCAAQYARTVRNDAIVASLRGCASLKDESADDILVKASKAADPKDVMKNIKTMVLTSKIVAPNGFPGRLVIRMRFPDTIRIEEETAEDTIIKAYNGSKGWEFTTLSGYRELRGRELDDLRFQTVFYISPNNNLKDIFAKAALDGGKTIGKIDCHKLIGDPLSIYNATPVVLYIDKRTHMLVKTEQAHNTLQGKWEISRTFSDYESMEGVMMPRRISSNVNYRDSTINVESVMWNEEIDASKFNPPDALTK